jgi:hypothetical protein
MDNWTNVFSTSKVVTPCEYFQRAHTQLTALGTPCPNLSALPWLPPPPALPDRQPAMHLTPPVKYRCRPLPHPVELEISFVMENNIFKMKVTLDRYGPRLITGKNYSPPSEYAVKIILRVLSMQ